MSSRAISVSSPLYVVMLGLLSALPPFGTDAGLPGLPDLQASLSIDAARAAQTLTLFLLGFSIGPVLFGPLSDRYGRKPVLLIGVALFSVTALGCAMAQSIDTLLMLRVLQGVGAGAAASLPAAIVRDVYRDELALSRQSYVALVNGVAPLVAPLLGALLLMLGGWRGIYASLALVGGALFLLAAFGYAETAPRPQMAARTPVLGAALSAYRTVLGDRIFVLSTALLATTFGTMFAYITGSSAVFMDLLGASPTLYGVLFACTAAGTIAGAASTGRMSRALGAGRMLRWAVLGNVAACALLLCVGWLGLQSMLLAAVLVIASNFCAGIIMPTVTHTGLRDLGAVAGSAAALQRGVQMIGGSAFGALVSLVGGQALVAMALPMTIAALLSGVFLLALSKKERRRQAAALESCR